VKKEGSVGPISALTGQDAEIRIRGSFFAEGYPSGQREQTVNLPAYAFVGSNPTPSTGEEVRVPRRQISGGAGWVTQRHHTRRV
jgi:hypothetical protein